MTFRVPFALTAALATAALAGCASGPGPAELGRLGFMVGCWQSAPDATGRTNKEVWSAPQGGLMFGYATTSEAGQLAFFEQTRIDIRGARATYTASPDGQRPTIFTEATANPGGSILSNTVTFENPDHDYPQRITYRAAGRGLAATISKLDGSRVTEYAWDRCR